jgi:hypothetical protein
MAKVLQMVGTAKKVPLFFVFFMTLVAFSTTASAQTIRGKVIDSHTGESIIGASVIVKGNTAQTGAATDINGEFVVNVRSIPAVIEVSYLGYKPQEIDIYEITEHVVVHLTEDLNRLNEIVVVGYGTQKRSDLTGSVSSVRTSELQQTPIVSIDQGLGGRASGVQVVQTSGMPGAVASIRFRGTTSLQGGNEPLYVIDGFPVYSGSGFGNTGFQNTVKRSCYGESFGHRIH